MCHSILLYSIPMTLEHPQSTHDLGRTQRDWKRKSISLRSLQVFQNRFRYPLKWKYPQSGFLLVGKKYGHERSSSNLRLGKMASMKFGLGQSEDLRHKMQWQWRWKFHPKLPGFHEGCEHHKNHSDQSNVQAFIEGIWIPKLRRRLRKVQYKGLQLD